MPRFLLYVPVALLYALCGHFSGRYFLTDEIVGTLDPRFFATPLPFAVVSWFILPHPVGWRALLPIALTVPVWLAAYFAGFVGYFVRFGFSYLPALLGGFVGGAGAALILSDWDERLRQRWWFRGAALIGGLAAALFGTAETWLEHSPDQMAAGFSLWQAAIGLYLYFALNHFRRIDQREAEPVA